MNVHPIEKLWREHDLPEWFLGNGGSNAKLYALFDAIRAYGKPAQSDKPEVDVFELVSRKGAMRAQWTYDPEAEAYYFAPMQAAPGPYLKQRHVDAIIDIASDGTLAGVELIDDMPPPPKARA